MTIKTAGRNGHISRTGRRHARWPELPILKWTSDLDGPLDDGIADADGRVLYSIADLSLGTHTITLRAVDTEGEANQDCLGLFGGDFRTTSDRNTFT